MNSANIAEQFAAFMREIDSPPSFGTLTLEVVICDGKVKRAEIVRRRTYLVPEDQTERTSKGQAR